MKLDSTYTQVWSTILMMPELPTIAQAYQILDQEQRHQNLSKLYDSHQESLAFDADRKPYFNRYKPPHWTDKPKTSGTKRPGSYYCENCKVYGLSLKRWWKVHGYPPNLKPNTWRRQHGAAPIAQGNTNSEDDSPITTKLTNSQYKQLLNILNKETNTSSDNNTALLAGISCCTTHSNKSWILDNGASDHMTHDLHLFHSYTTVRSTYHVITIPDGKKVNVECIGTVLLHNVVVLKEVLYVPDFHYNFISLSKLCQDLSCKVLFTSSACFDLDNLTLSPWLLCKIDHGLYHIATKSAFLLYSCKRLQDYISAICS